MNEKKARYLNSHPNFHPYPVQVCDPWMLPVAFPAWQNDR